MHLPRDWKLSELFEHFTQFLVANIGYYSTTHFFVNTFFKKILCFFIGTKMGQKSRPERPAEQANNTSRHQPDCVGMVMINTTPSSVLRAHTVPPWRATTAFTMESPMPLPPYSLVRALSTL